MPRRGAALSLAIAIAMGVPSAGLAAGTQTVTTTVTSSTPASTTTASSTTTGDSSTSQSGSTTTTTTTSSTGTGEARPTSRDETLALLALLFGAIGILTVAFFLGLDRSDTRKTFKATVATGQGVTGVAEPAGPGPIALAMAAIGGGAPTIEGPSEVVVGVASAFVARQEGNEAIATWAVAPPTAAEVSADPTNRLLLVAKEAVPFKLTATVAGEASAPKQIKARSASSPASTLPFLGAGWGAVVVAIVIATVTAALGFAHALSTDAVATILGALVGYVVARSQGESSSGGTAGAGGGKGAAGANQAGH